VPGWRRQHLQLGDGRGCEPRDHEDAELAVAVGLEGHFHVGHGRARDAPGDLLQPFVDRRVEGAIGALVQVGAGPAGLPDAGHAPVHAGRPAVDVVPIVQERCVHDREAGHGRGRHDALPEPEAAAPDRLDIVGRALLDDRLPGQLEVGPDVDLQHPDRQAAPVLQRDGDHVTGSTSRWVQGRCHAWLVRSAQARKH
jgi:hypothetical protein